MGDESRLRRSPGAGLAIHAVVFGAVNVALITWWARFDPAGAFDELPCVLVHAGEAEAHGFFPRTVLLVWTPALLLHALVVAVTAPARARRRSRVSRQPVGGSGGRSRGGGGYRAGGGEGRSNGDDKARPRGLGPAPASPIADVFARHNDRSGQAYARASAPDAPGERGEPASPGEARKGQSTPRATWVRGASRGGPRQPRSIDQSPRAGPGAAPNSTAAMAPRFGRRASDRTGARHWVAVLFTDIVDSTPLNEHYGDDIWAALLVEHRSLVRQGIGDYRGVEVGTQGDGFLIRFEAPDDAAAFAIFLQRHLAEHRRGLDPELHIRIGVHAGEVVQNDDDLVGRVINLASRVTGAAEADEILVTEPFADHLSPGHPLVDRGLQTLKGFDRPRHLLALTWREDD